MKRILIVEDNADLAFGLRNSLEIASYEVIVASDGPSGLREARTVSPDLIILDLMLPGMDGYRVLRAVREGGSQVPVLILTARGEEADKVTGFRLGADDYVTKPFGVLELVARVEAVLRRASTTPKDGAPDTSRFGEIEIQPVARVVRRNGRAVELSPKEYELLLALVQRPGQVVSRSELLKTVWGYHASVVSRTIDTHIAELRRKLEVDPASPRHLLSVRKVGYQLRV